MVKPVGSLPPASVARGEFLPRAGARGSVGRVSKTPPRSPRRPADPRTRLLRSALDVMNCLLHEPRSLGISEVAARLALPKSTTFRVLRALVELELVHKDAGTRRYSLTSRVFGLAHELSLHFGPLGKFSKVLRSEAARLRASLYVSTLCGGFTYVVAASGSLGDSFALGGHAPVYASSAGKILVAGHPREEWPAYAPSRSAVKLAPRTNVDPVRFARELEEAQRTGVAWNREESSLRHISVSAAIPEAGRVPRFAVAILFRREELVLRDTRELEDAVRRIAARLASS